MAASNLLFRPVFRPFQKPRSKLHHPFLGNLNEKVFQKPKEILPTDGRSQKLCFNFKNSIFCFLDQPVLVNQPNRHPLPGAVFAGQMHPLGRGQGRLDHVDPGRLHGHLQALLGRLADQRLGGSTNLQIKKIQKPH